MAQEYERCFVALQPDEATCSRLLGLPRMGRARPVGFDDLHLTVAFFGNLDSDTAHALAGALAPMVRPIATLQHTGLMLWPTPQRARVVVASYELTPELEALHHEVTALGEAHGVPAEGRRYRPHITVARLPRTLRVMPQQALDNLQAQVGAASFTHLGLYARAPDGNEHHRYQTLVEIPLPVTEVPA